MKLIIFPYLNRYLFSKNLISKRVGVKKIIIDNDKRLNNYVRYYDSNIFIKNEANSYAKEWLDNLIKGTYSISFPAYILATEIIKMDVFKDYFSLRYPTIYIDEAQDLNYFQHMMLNTLKDNNDNIIREGVHFDLSHRNMILWDYDNLDEFKNALRKRIEAVII